MNLFYPNNFAESTICGTNGFPSTSGSQLLLSSSLILSTNISVLATSNPSFRCSTTPLLTKVSHVICCFCSHVDFLMTSRYIL